MEFVRAVKNCLKWIIPYGMIENRRKKLIERSYQEYPKTNTIRNYFLGLNRDEQNIDIIEIMDYLDKYGFSMFPYEFPCRYNSDGVKCFYDAQCKMHFVLHQGKRMYFPRIWSKKEVCGYYNGLCAEQDAASPHRYETKEYTVREGDIIADMGVAEGVWALTYAEKAARIYLFECENMWIEALQKTFEPWNEKVVVVNKYVSDESGDEKITLDEFFKDKEINFIKADIEGSEIELLKGGKSILSRIGNLSLILSAYHRQDDARILKEILEDNGFETEYSNRYMLFIHDIEIKEPYIRRGIIRARKNQAR